MKIGLFIGHSRQGDDGACDYSGVTYEWQYNAALVKELKAKLVKMGIPESDLVYIDDYKTSSYNQAVAYVCSVIKKEKIDLGIEFHFNSAESHANGFEYIYFERSNLGKKYATKFATAHKNIINSGKARGDNGIVARGSGRGAAMLEHTSCPFIITEPFFGSNKAEADFFLSPEGRLALIEVYSKAIVDCYGRISDAQAGEHVDMIKKLKEAQTNLTAAEKSPSGLDAVLNDIKDMLNQPPFKTVHE